MLQCEAPVLVPMWGFTVSRSGISNAESQNDWTPAVGSAVHSTVDSPVDFYCGVYCALEDFTVDSYCGPESALDNRLYCRLVGVL